MDIRAHYFSLHQSKKSFDTLGIAYPAELEALQNAQWIQQDEIESFSSEDDGAPIHSVDHDHVSTTRAVCANHAKHTRKRHRY